MREGCQQAADLGGGHGDEVAYVVAAMVIMPQACRESCPQPRVPPLSCADLKEGKREHGQCGVPVPGVVAADLVVVQAGLVLGGLEAFLDRPPGVGHPHELSQRGAARALGPDHVVDEFASANADLEIWLGRHALAVQHMGSFWTFVLVQGGHLLGYFSLTMGSVPRRRAAQAGARPAVPSSRDGPAGPSGG
jgi:hypothetical protein